MKNNGPHPGIAIHKIPVAACFAGILFTIGSMAIFLLGLPVLWYFLAFGLALGVAFAIVFRIAHKREVPQVHLLDADRRKQ